MLRLYAVLRRHFNLELQAHTPFFTKLKEDLRKRSLITSWGHRLALDHFRSFFFVEVEASLPNSDGLLLERDSHPRVLGMDSVCLTQLPCVGNSTCFHCRTYTAPSKQKPGPKVLAPIEGGPHKRVSHIGPQATAIIFANHHCS